VSQTRRFLTRKIMVRSAFVFAAFLTLLVSFYCVEKWRGQRAWEACRADAERRGVKLWLREYVGPEIPAAENYAAVPFIDELFRAANAREEPRNPLPPVVVDGKDRPKLSEIATGTRPVIAEWRDYFAAGGLIEKSSDDPARDLLTMLAKRAPVLQQLRDASSRRGCRFPTPWEKGIATPVPHLMPLRQAAFFLRLGASAHLAAGEFAQAAAECHHLFRLHAALRTEPILIAGLNGLAVLDHALGSLWEGLAARQWTEDDLATMERDLAGLNAFADFRLGIGSERGLMNTEFDRMAGMPMGDLFRLAGFFNGNVSPVGLAMYPTGWIRRNMVSANQYFDDMLAAYQPVEGREPEFILAHGKSDDWVREHLGTSGFDRYYYAFLNLALPSVDRCEATFLHGKTRGDQARLACALERFRRVNGGFPETLEALIPKFIAAIPKDVCDGKPMRYRRTADGGYELWSVATNRKDDGGQSVGADKDAPEPPDWVWRMPGR
jgi:hypothetical protein